MSEEDEANAFVESLFGIAKPTRKRSVIPVKKTRNRSMAQRRSLTVLPSDHDSLSSTEIMAFELKNMLKAEADQKRVDRFWGLDKESFDCQRERVQMSNESELSLAQEMKYRTAQKRIQWEKEEQIKNYESAYLSSIREGQARKAYMRTLYQAESSVDVIFFDWPTRPHVKPIPQKNHDKKRVDESVKDDIESMVESYLRRPQSGFEIIDMLEVQSPVHLGGRQQTRSIVSADSEPASSGHIIGEITRGGSTSVAAAAMQPLDFRKSMKSRQRSRSRNRRQGIDAVGTLSRSLTMSSFSPQKAKERDRSVDKGLLQRSVSFAASPRPGTSDSIMSVRGSVGSRRVSNPSALPITKPKYLETVDGHPVHKWDQVMMLREVYALMDHTGDGRVDATQLANIRNDVTILQLLRLTVLGVWVKRRQWAKFQNLLKGHTSISLLDLVQAARELSTESQVSPRLIRTEDEHKSIEYALYHVSQCSDSLDQDIAFGSFYAEKMRQQSSRPLRDAYLSRSLAQGDCVWGMIAGACVWLPAVVEAVNENGTYDLSYPLTLAALHQAKVMATSRELLSLPIQPSEKMLVPRPFKTEKEVCSYVFDVIAGSSSTKPNDTLNSIRLQSALQSDAYREVVRTSAALSLLVGGAEEYQYPSPNEFLTIFCNEHDDIEKGIQKSDFVNYCLNLLEIIGEINRVQ
mmetsp:Transcript_9123/g.9184  ORF Transcript_9123/g.9184 Transcript_9123/m.9184 type:complete len:689 (+) Transcript_9123:153-2219(+)